MLGAAPPPSVYCRLGGRDFLPERGLDVSVNTRLCRSPGVCSGWSEDTRAGLQRPDGGRVGGLVGEPPLRRQGHQLQGGPTGRCL